MRKIFFRSLVCMIVATSFMGVASSGVAAQSANGASSSSGGSKSYRSAQSFQRSDDKIKARKGQGKEDVLASLNRPDGSSLWSDTSPFFFTDRRAAKVGDIVTVLISESSNAKKEADTNISKDSDLTFTAPAIPGYGEILATSKKRARRFDGADTLRTTGGIGQKTETDVARTDTLSATISARIVEVFPNGNLFIEGRRELTTHKETLIVMVSGIARPEDIDANNNIQSKFLADAKILYTGDGILQEAQSPGWLTRVVTKLWPF